MYFHWGFPMLVVPALAAADSPNLAFTFVVAMVVAAVGIYGLGANTKEYRKDDAVAGFLMLLFAAVIVVFGMIPLVLFTMTVAAVYYFIRYFVWRGLIYWILWRTVAKNIFAIFRKN